MNLADDKVVTSVTELLQEYDIAPDRLTLEVTETQAERVALAGRLGHLSLIVRAADAAPGARLENPATTWGGDVSPALNQGHTAGRVMKIYQGTTDGKEFRF